jgi:hypothetical protein
MNVDTTSAHSFKVISDYTVKNIFFVALTARTDAEISILVQNCTPKAEFVNF